VPPSGCLGSAGEFLTGFSKPIMLGQKSESTDFQKAVVGACCAWLQWPRFFSAAMLQLVTCSLP
jgi:hypothetical protein